MFRCVQALKLGGQPIVGWLMVGKGGIVLKLVVRMRVFIMALMVVWKVVRNCG